MSPSSFALVLSKRAYGVRAVSADSVMFTILYRDLESCRPGDVIQWRRYPQPCWFVMDHKPAEFVRRELFSWYYAIEGNPDKVRRREMDRKTTLAKIPIHLHGAANEMAAAGIDWRSIGALLLQLLPVILKLFEKQPQPQPMTHGHCPEEAKAALVSAREAALDTLCQVMCAEHCLGCHVDE